MRARSKTLGAAFFGTADLRPARDFITAQGGPFLKKFPSAISIGMPLAHGIVDELHQHSNPKVIGTYHFHIYHVVNHHLDRIALEMSRMLQERGHLALPVSASQTLDRKRHAALFSHKLAAHLAGHGWIGKNCLLITPEMGPRVRWATVLTDAPLPPGQLMEDECGKCKACVVECPSKAFSGVPFVASEPREVRMDADKCYEHMDEQERRLGARACGMCVYICPIGMPKRRKKARARS
ncbi:MAG: epoxyqueuosine reductase [Chloroflexi bacterium]|nr:epoxyqueuosine reductase [Chloroflexota bacterium]